MRQNGIGMFPAYAGMIPDAVIRDHMRFDVPRIRGDDPGSIAVVSIDGACSPHTRG